MNKMQYKLRNYYFKKSGHKKENLKPFIEEEYQQLEIISQKFLEENLYFSKQEFAKLITGIYDVLKLSLHTNEFYRVIEHYIYLIVQDCAYERETIDMAWWLDKIYYLGTYPEPEIKEILVRDIPYIQDSLYQKFHIEETFVDKMNRRSKIKSLGAEWK